MLLSMASVIYHVFILGKGLETCVTNLLLGLLAAITAALSAIFLGKNPLGVTPQLGGGQGGVVHKIKEEVEKVG